MNKTQKMHIDICKYFFLIPEARLLMKLLVILMTLEMLSVIACFSEVGIFKVSTLFSNASQHLYCCVVCIKKLAHRYN